VAKVPKAVPFVLVQVIAPVFAIVQSPDIATAVGTFEPLPTQISPDANEGGAISGPNNTIARGVVEAVLVVSTRPSTCPEGG